MLKGLNSRLLPLVLPINKQLAELLMALKLKNCMFIQQPSLAWKPLVPILSPLAKPLHLGPTSVIDLRPIYIELKYEVLRGTNDNQWGVYVS